MIRTSFSYKTFPYFYYLGYDWCEQDGEVQVDGSYEGCTRRFGRGENDFVDLCSSSERSRRRYQELDSGLHFLR